MKFRIAISIFPLLTLFLTACAVTPTQRPSRAIVDESRNEPQNQRLGHPAVYAQIDSLNDCQQLQEEFNTAMGNAERRPPGDRNRKISLAYAEYAEQRKQDIGCYR